MPLFLFVFVRFHVLRDVHQGVEFLHCDVGFTEYIDVTPCVYRTVPFFGKTGNLGECFYEGQTVCVTCDPCLWYLDFPESILVEDEA